VKIAFSHAGLTHYGGIMFFNEFSRMLQLRRFLTGRLRYPPAQRTDPLAEPTYSAISEFAPHSQVRRGDTPSDLQVKTAGAPKLLV